MASAGTRSSRAQLPPAARLAALGHGGRRGAAQRAGSFLSGGARQREGVGNPAPRPQPQVHKCAPATVGGFFFSPLISLVMATSVDLLLPVQKVGCCIV